MLLESGNNLTRVRRSNQAAVHRLLYHYGPMTRAELAERLDLTMPTITKNINHMIELGIAAEVGGLNGSAKLPGRRAEFVDIVPSSRHFLGVEMRGTRRAVCVTDYRGGILYSALDDGTCTDYDQALALCCDMIRTAPERSGLGWEDISGLGIGLPGLVDSERGVLRHLQRYHWENRNVVQALREGTGYDGPILLNNNVCARAYAAKLFRRERLNGVPSFAYLFVATGIACPLILNFMQEYGILLGDGEAGHVAMDADGPRCSCGNYGCLEAYSGEQAVVARCEEAMQMGEAPALRRMCGGKTPTMKQILRAQNEGDPGVCLIVGTAVRMLGMALANFDNFTRPSVILVEAELFENQQNRQAMLQTIDRHLFGKSAGEMHLEFVTPDPISGAVGGAALAVRNYLETAIP